MIKLLFTLLCTVTLISASLSQIRIINGVDQQAEPTDNVQNADFAFIMPGQVLKTKFNSELPLIAALIESMKIPSTCCYDHVGEDLVHLDFQGIKFGTITPLGNMTISTSGINVDVGGSVEVEFNYRLCIHDDPFGHGCSTLYGCKGDGKQVTILGQGGLNMVLGVDGKGDPMVTPSGENFVAKETSDSICGKINDEIAKQMPGLSDKIKALIGPLFTEEVKKVLVEIPGTVNFGNDTAIQWTLDNQTKTLNDAVQIVGDFTILSRKNNNAPGPFKPTGGLPLVTPDDKAHILIQQNVLSNFAWSFYEAGVFEKDIVLPLPEGKFNLTVELSQSPSFQIGSSGPVITFNGFMAVSLNETFMFQVDFEFEALVVLSIADNKIGAQIDSINVESIKLEVHANHTVIDESWVDGLVTFALTSELPKVNAILKAKEFPLPAFKSFKLTNPSISYLPLAMHISADVSVSSDASFAKSHLMQTLAPKPITCPPIPGAHLDGCI